MAEFKYKDGQEPKPLGIRIEEEFAQNQREGKYGLFGAQLRWEIDERDARAETPTEIQAQIYALSLEYFELDVQVRANLYLDRSAIARLEWLRLEIPRLKGKIDKWRQEDRERQRKRDIHEAEKKIEAQATILREEIKGMLLHQHDLRQLQQANRDHIHTLQCEIDQLARDINKTQQELTRMTSSVTSDEQVTVASTLETNSKK